MSDCGDEPAATAGAGRSQCVSTALTSELIAALNAVQSVTPAAPADSLPAADDAAAASAPSNEERVAADLSEDVTSPPAIRSKSQTSRKRCRPTEAAASVKKQVTSRSKDAEHDRPTSRRHIKDYDSERLKAFNMFVRLFVDENLDRVSPISKQPKDKIQAILEACDRQFPEFHVRSRKRIRTYLKSCRRLRRCKDLPDSPQARQMALPHLTSPEAESILAQACENESNNAKRMRMGLEALTASDMARLTSSSSPPPPTSSSFSTQKTSPSSTDTACSQDDDDQPLQLTSHMRLAAACTGSTSLTPLSAVMSMSQPQLTLAANTLRWDGRGYEMMPAPSSVLLSAYCDAMQTAPTDLSVKKVSSNNASPPPTSSAASAAETSCCSESPAAIRALTESVTATTRLNAAEVSAIRQLIAGYRESAAFLIRSADELQQLIIHQNN